MDSSSGSEPSPESSKSIIQKLKEIEQAVWKRRPILEEVVSKRSDKSLYEYAQGFVDINPVPELEKRRPELFSVVEKLLQERVGAEVAQGVVRQLQKIPLVSTADHHGPINNPFFVNSNIISGIPHGAVADSDIKYLIAFSFASISINNSSYPRGIEFNTDHDGIAKVSFFPDKLKMGVAYVTRAFTNEDLDRAVKEIKQKEGEGFIARDKSEKMVSVIRKHFAADHVLKSEDFASQITKLNLDLWPALFGGNPCPDLIYLEIETIVTELLLNHHLKNQTSLIYKFLFDEKWRKLIYKYFNNIDGAFSLEQGWGSFMFWGLDEKGRRVALNLQDDRLVSKDGKYSFAYKSEDIAKALRAKQIFPSMLVCYLMISLYYGIKCLGGFSQVHDLTLTKEAWISMLHELGEFQEAEAVLPMQTKEYGGDGMMLAYLPSDSGKILPAYGLEMAIGEAEGGFDQYVEFSKSVTISEAIAPMMPEIYNVLYSQDERRPELSELESAEIAKAICLLDKLSGKKTN